MSLDGRTALASGESRWITGEAARADVQRLRARAGAILTGSAPCWPTIRASTCGCRARSASRCAWCSTDSSRPPAGAAARAARRGAGVHAAAQRGGGALAARGVRVETVPGPSAGLDLAAVLARLAALEVNELHGRVRSRAGRALLEAGWWTNWCSTSRRCCSAPSARPLVDLPPLRDLGQRLEFRINDVRRIGPDLRLESCDQSHVRGGS
jgi:diaminohydroxyphosphoribosylaminopyrimidine deaminase / 5-amino-6-(5-phosphoribosylamino)uracil reductase